MHNYLKNSHLIFNPSARRYIFTTRSPSIRNKALFVNNAGIFALHWVLTKSPFIDKCKELIKNGKITIFYQKPWFINIHPSHSDNEWGQSFEELPQHVKGLFRRFVCKDYPASQPLKFHQISKLHQSAVDELCEIFDKNSKTKQFLEITDNPALTVEKHSSEYSIKILDGSSRSLEKNTFFYNWMRTPRKHSWPALEQNYTSDLYRLPKDFFTKNVLKNIIVDGASLTIPWIFRDFPDVNIFLLKRQEDAITEVPRNKNIKMKDMLTFIMQDNGVITHDEQVCELKPLGDKNKKMAVFLYSKGTEKFTAAGYYYVSRGLTTRLTLTENIAAKDKLELPVPEKDEVLVHGRWSKWIAPQNIPAGSLTESYLLWMSATENIQYCYEPQAYHNNHFRDIFGNMSHGKFFNSIDERVKLMETVENIDAFHDIFEEIHKKNRAEPLLTDYTRIGSRSR